MRVKPAPADGCPVDPADTHAAAPEFSRNAHRLDRAPQRIAYDLWCLQENRRIARQPLASLDGLIHVCQGTEPVAGDPGHRAGNRIVPGLDADGSHRSCAARHRYVFEVPRLRPRTVVARAVPGDRSIAGVQRLHCQGFARYNDKNDRTPTRVIRTQQEVCRHQKSKSSAPKLKTPPRRGFQGISYKITDQRSAKDDNQIQHLNLIIADRLGICKISSEGYLSLLTRGVL